MNVVTILKRRASDRPVGTFLGVLVMYSAAITAAIYTLLEGASPILRVTIYAWGPMISAGITVWLLNESVRDWLGQLRNLKVNPRWYVVGIGIMMIGTEFETIIGLISGADVTVPAAPPMAYIRNFLITFFIAGALEELGWRGFLQPRLQQQFTALWTSVGIGALWGLWHVPMILAGLGDFTVFWEYMLNIIVMSIILGWLYNSTNAALPVVMVTHASHNMPPIGSPTGNIPGIFNALSGDAIFYVLCASLITVYAGSQTLTRDGTLPTVPGQLKAHLPVSGRSAE
ncbi:MAG: putative metal-dependent membrane protease [Haloquadratum sp. J07HQX50]|nr:MAG: putative metal-dependent membrane protease [Haloquadratum sp. J07HQX50]